MTAMFLWNDKNLLLAIVCRLLVVLLLSAVAMPAQTLSSYHGKDLVSYNNSLQTGVLMNYTPEKPAAFSTKGDSVISAIAAGNFRSCATFTSHLSSAVFTAVSEYFPSGGPGEDKIKLYVSYNNGASWQLKSTFSGFLPTVDCRKNELDLEVVISGSDTIAFIAVGYDYAGHALSGLLRVNIQTGANAFSTWQFGGWNSSSVNTYNPRVSSNNTKYGNTAAVFMTVAHDSAVVPGGFKSAQRFAILLTPFSDNTLTYRVANSLNGGFYHGHLTTLRPYLWQDICYLDSAGTDILYSVYYNARTTTAPSPFILRAKSFDYGLTSANEGFLYAFIDTIDQVRIASAWSTGRPNMLIGFRSRNAAGNFDFPIFATANSGLNWSFQYAENNTDTCVFVDFQEIKLSGGRYRLAYTTRGKNHYYRSLKYFVGSSFIFSPASQVNNLAADIDFFGVKAGYVNSNTGDSCLAVWGRDTSLGLTDLYVSRECQLVTGITPENIPLGFSLSQNYPNPFNPFTVIKFDIARTGYTKLTIYDILGREVSIPVNENLNPCSYSINFDASKLTSGTYFYKLESGDISETKKMLLVK